MTGEIMVGVMVIDSLVDATFATSDRSAPSEETSGTKA